jgi:hypothetical protein
MILKMELLDHYGSGDRALEYHAFGDGTIELTWFQTLN